MQYTLCRSESNGFTDVDELEGRKIVSGHVRGISSPSNSRITGGDEVGLLCYPFDVQNQSTALTWVN